MIEFSREDLLRSKLIKPAWYRVHIKSIGQALSKNGDSTNYPVDGVIKFNADDGSLEYKDVPIGGIPTWFFNSKAKGFMVGFIKALDPTTEINDGFRFNEKAAEDKDIDVFVDNELWDGTMRNRVNHKYRAPRAVPESQS